MTVNQRDGLGTTGLQDNAGDTSTDQGYLPGELGDFARISDRIKEDIRAEHLAPRRDSIEPIKLGVTQVADLLQKSTNGIRRLDKQDVLDLKLIRGDRQRVYYTLDQVEIIRRHFRQMPRRSDSDPTAIVAINSLKGGSSKSATTLHLAHRYALDGYRVLVLDCDPQGTITSYFGLRPDVDVDDDITIGPIIAGDHTNLLPCIQKTHFHGLDYVPASLEMYGSEMMAYARQMQRNQDPKQRNWRYYESLSIAIDTVKDNYDIILLDTPPSLSAMTFNALYASNCLLVPMAPAMDELLSVAQYFSLVNEWYATVAKIDPSFGHPECGGKPFHWVRIALTRYNRSTAEKLVMQFIAQRMGKERVLRNFVVHSSEVSNAAANRKSLYELDGPIGSREAYRRALASMDGMATEVRELIESTWPSHGKAGELDLWSDGGPEEGSDVMLPAEGAA